MLFRSYGIGLVSTTGARVLNNDVLNTVKQGTGTAYGIDFDSSNQWC